MLAPTGRISAGAAGEEKGDAHAEEVSDDRVLVPERELYVTDVLREPDVSAPNGRSCRFATHAFREIVAWGGRDVSGDVDLSGNGSLSIGWVARRLMVMAYLHAAVPEGLQLHVEPVELQVARVITLFVLATTDS